MSSAAPDTHSLTLHGLPVVSVPSFGTGVLSIPSNYTAVINNELWLVNKDHNTGVLTRVCQISLPQGYKLAPDQAPAPYDPEGTDMIPSHLQGCVHGLLNKHLKMQPKLAGMRAYAVQRWLYNYQLNLSNLVNDEQYLDERRQRQDALRHKEADDIGHAERVKYIQEEAIRGKKRLDQVYEAGAPAAAP